MSFKIDGNSMFVDGTLPDLSLIDAQYVMIDGQYRLISNTVFTGQDYRTTVDGQYIFIDGNYSWIDGNIPNNQAQITMTQAEIDAQNASGNIIYLDGNIIFTDGNEIFFMKQNTSTTDYTGNSINANVTKIRRILKQDLIINENNVIIPSQTTFIKGFVASNCGARIEIPYGIVKSVQSIRIDTPDGQVIYHDEHLLADNVIVLTAGGVPVPCYPAGSTITVDLEYFEKVSRSNIILKYSYGGSPKNSIISINYAYDKNNDGFLDRRFFFSDIRGDIIENEYDWSPTVDNVTGANPLGFNGFVASNFDDITSVLTFPLDPRVGLIPGMPDLPENYYEHGKNNNRSYSTIVNGVTTMGGMLNEVLTSPYRDTRFSKCEQLIDQSGNVTYSSFDETTCFGKVQETIVKDTIDIIVKEGSIRRWDTETPQSIIDRQNAIDNNTLIPDKVYVNNDLTVYPTVDMVNAGYFSIEDPNIEDDGIELYVTKYVNSSLVENIPYNRSKTLIAEKNVSSNTFISATDIENENMVRIYTKYAENGQAFDLNTIFRMNVFDSSGLLGFASGIIKSDNKDFVTIDYIPNTPYVLHIAGSDIEKDTDIKTNAPLFSNTGNRAVTTKDYKTIADSQDFVNYSQVWGGEREVPVENPGNVYFSIIPYSRPTTFTGTVDNYSLDNISSSELFYPTYYQVTGKNTYIDINDNNPTSLFNILSNYQIITLKFNYVKPVYIDFDVNVRVLKYKLGTTRKDTNKLMFDSINSFFKNKIELFNSSFYTSSLSRNMDTVLGDYYGLVSSVNMSVDLFDDKTNPDKGTFFNATMRDLEVDNTTGFIGDRDYWKFEMMLAFPVEPLFTQTITRKLSVIKRGEIIFDNLTKCDTIDFIVPGDKLYLEPVDLNYTSRDTSGNIENKDPLIDVVVRPSDMSSVITIPLIYMPIASDLNAVRYKVGDLTIYKKENLCKLTINTHSNVNIDSSSGNTTISNVFVYDEIQQRIINKDVTLNSGTYIEYNSNGTETHYNWIEAPLRRDSFTGSIKKLNITAKNDNIKIERNTFSRLRNVTFN